MNKDEIRILTFDCYGTLIDWESAIITQFNTIWPMLTLSENAILKWFAETEFVIQADNPKLPYHKVLEQVILSIAKKNGLAITDDQIRSFGASVKNWNPFDDTVQALRLLAEKYKLAIISNIDNASIAATKLKLEVPFFKTYTAENIGAYKPDHKVFRYVFEDLHALGYGKNQMLHVAESLFHDHVPAKALDLNSVWVHRRYGKIGSGATPQVDDIYKPDLIFKDLLSFARWMMTIG